MSSTVTAFVLFIRYTASKIVGTTGCEWVTNDNYWQVYGNMVFNDSHCDELGANDYVSVHSSQDIEIIGELCSNCEFGGSAWIGVELETCYNDSNFTLNWTDNKTSVNYSLIEWCDGYPNNLCVNRSIYFYCGNTPNNCFKNGATNLTQPAICATPTQCLVFVLRLI